MDSKTSSNTTLSEDILNVLLQRIKQNNIDPFYVYLKDNIRKKCKLFSQLSYENKSIHFASMANSHPDFLKIIREENLKIFVNSPLHLELSLQAGFNDSDIIYTASAMSKETMIYAQKHNTIVNLDSVNQLKQWNKLFPSAKVGIRCNIGDSVKPKHTRGGYFIGKNSRLGFSLDEIAALRSNEIINGLHLYVGTDIIDIDYFIACYSELLKLAKYYPSLDYIDVGGGFGIKEQTEEEFDFTTYDRKVKQLMDDFSAEMGKSIKLIIEPGRIIGGEAGYFISTVIDVKERNGMQYVGVHASSVQFPRPLLYPDDSWHPTYILSSEGVQKQDLLINSSVFGCSTYSRDFLAKDVLLPKAEINNIIILGNAGSYCASSHIKFLGYAPAKEIFV